MTDLPALLARVEAATGPDRELDAELSRAFGVQYIPNHNNNGPKFVSRPLTSSLDATVALVEKLRPGWGAVSGHNPGHLCSTAPARETYFCNMAPHFKLTRVVGHRYTEPLARLAALLRSMIEGEGR